MSDDRAPRPPNFECFLSDVLEEYASPEDFWKKQWGGYPEGGELLHKTLNAVVHSLEGLASSQDEERHELLKGWSEQWAWSVDWWYTKEALERVPAIIKRFEKLTPILTRVAHHQEANVYLREATQCFLYGFIQASTTLFRSALEAGLKDLCERKLGAKPGVELVDLINQAVRFNLLSKMSGSMASNVRTTANRVVHEEPITEQGAFDVLVQTRCVLEEIYR